VTEGDGACAHLKADRLPRPLEELVEAPHEHVHKESDPSRSGKSARRKVASETDRGDRKADIGYALQAFPQGDCCFAD
jgi:hypothetical protein